MSQGNTVFRNLTRAIFLPQILQKTMRLIPRDKFHFARRRMRAKLARGFVQSERILPDGQISLSVVPA
jgi:hypothetical protein